MNRSRNLYRWCIRAAQSGISLVLCTAVIVMSSGFAPVAACDVQTPGTAPAPSAETPACHGEAPATRSPAPHCPVTLQADGCCCIAGVPAGVPAQTRSDFSTTTISGPQVHFALRSLPSLETVSNDTRARIPIRTVPGRTNALFIAHRALLI